MADEQTGISAEPLSTVDAGAMIGQMLESAEAPKVVRGPDGKFQSTKPRDEEPAEEQPEESDDPKAEESPADEPADEAEQPTDEQEPAEEEEKAPPRMVTVKVDGMEVEVDEEELKRGYSRHADYTRKTQAHADTVRRFEEEVATPTRAMRDQYAERLAVLEQVVQLPGEEPNWEDLRNRLSPEDFTQQFAEWRTAQKRLATVRAERERVEAERHAEMERHRQARIASEREKLLTAIPELKDPEKGKARTADLLAYAAALGYPEDAVNQVEDHQLLVLLDKARLWDESQKRKPKLEEKVTRAIEAIKPSAAKPKPRHSDTERAKASLAPSGSVDDAATLITAMLKPPKRAA